MNSLPKIADMLNQNERVCKSPSEYIYCISSTKEELEIDRKFPGTFGCRGFGFVPPFETMIESSYDPKAESYKTSHEKEKRIALILNHVRFDKPSVVTFVFQVIWNSL